MSTMNYSEVTDRVLEALQSDPRTREGIFDPSFANGALTLSGTVAGYEMRAAADEIARRQDGVITVINDLKVV